MPQYGALPDIGLPALLRLLLESACSGRLTLQQGAREGSLLLESGRLVGSAFGPWQGLNAVDALILALPAAADARFSFEEAT
ncbi:MAG TPA: DUF4388 domain-containing protein, partial [Chloroflexota bacterium]|nr:DUF4388 domain-containing protein [Chloroflexota bacterium]